MSILVQCPNPDCKASSMVEDSVSGRNVKCKRCGKPFVAKPTFDGHKSDTKKEKAASNTNPFPVLPAEFGRYRILRQLGRGGMGAVYLAQDTQLGRQVALKVPFFDASESPQRVERFVREARSAAILQHPNICTVFDAGQIDGRPFITMAYIAGTPLEKEIDPEAPMPQVRAAEIVRKIALALQHAHFTGIVHRDLKPANVMMAAGGEPVVMDFGLAKRVADVDPNEAKLTRDGGLLGTPSYMAPEQVKGDSSAIGPATDVYALGVILFEMLTGRTPYAGGITVVIGQILAAPAPPVKEFRPDVDSRLDAICRKAMAKEPADRFKSMTEFADTLSQYLKSPTASPPPSQIATVVRAAPPAAAVRTAFDDLEVAPRPIAVVKKAKQSRVAKAPPPWKKWPILAGAAAGILLAGLLLLWAVGVFKVKTPDGILVVEVNEPNAEVFVDGARMTVSWNDGGTKAEIHVKPGSRKVEVKKDGFSVDGKELTVKDGDREVFTARLVPDEPRMAKADAPPEKSPPPDTNKPDVRSDAGAADDDKGFVSLFNGKDLAGWYVEEKEKEKQWTVEAGAIVGTTPGGPGKRSYLLSNRDYGDFTLRLQFKVDPESNGGIGIRTLEKEGIDGRSREHPVLKVTDPVSNPNEPSGTTHWVKDDKQYCQPTQDLQLSAGKWHGLELTVRGDACIGVLDGKKVVDIRLDANAGATFVPGLKRANGKIGFQAGRGSVRFCRIEIKELPLAKTASTPLGAGENAAEITNSIGIKLKLIKPGKFLMGSPKEEKGREDSEGPQHEVEITKAFYMGAYPVTKGQFAAFVKDDGYQTEAEKDHKGGLGFNTTTARWVQKPEYTWRHTGFGQGDDHPVVDVSWNDATAFCAWLSKKEGKTYELPTEAEWEYACRAGTTTRFWWGDADASIQGNANIADASLKEKCPRAALTVPWYDYYAFTSPVGTFKPNPWGLYDMAGNVWQWCADDYGPYQEGSVKDPKHRESTNKRVLRGGSWWSAPLNCRSANRLNYDPAPRVDNFGFRVVLAQSGGMGSDGVNQPSANIDADRKEADDKGFTPLFNGKNLTGWKTHPSQPGNWRVEKGILTGSSNGVSHLYTDRGDYTDFHLRLEARLNLGDGFRSTGVFFRAPFGPNLPANEKMPVSRSNVPTWIAAYNAKIDARRLGGLLVDPNPELHRTREAVLRPGEWVAYEIIAEGNHFVIKVNGETTCDYVDEQRLHKKGHIVLQQHGAATVAEFRKIEIKELTPVKTAPAPKQPVSTTPANPFQEKSVWVNDKSAMMLTVIERKDNTFRAIWVVGNSEQAVNGTVKDDKVFWLAKDVRNIKGNGGAGNNHGTLSIDKDGEKIDFVYEVVDSGASGAYVLRLKAGK
jgi:formylglycine-generating enzyme required for sulfatase activity/predicted Ser/Thr protein kinase